MTEQETAALLLGIVGIGAIVLYILLVIAGWKIFKKAGEPGWKALIPIYDVYIFMKIVGMKTWFWVLILCFIATGVAQSVSNYYPNLADGILSFDFANHPVASVVIAVSYIAELTIEVYWAIRTAKAFGHGLGYTLGLVLLPNIFLLVIGFGSSKYDKKILKSTL